MRAVPVLTYHSLDDSDSVISVRPTVFRDQMQLLASRGYQAITATELLDAWDRGVAPPDRTVVITFDDAIANVARHALPLLAGLGFRATVFAVAGRLGQYNDWPEPAPGIPRLSLLSRDGLVELMAAGFEVGAHSVRHVRLSRLAPAERAEEIIAGRQLLEDQLGAAVTTFAYPYGDVNTETRTLVAAHYRAAFGTTLGLTTPARDRYELPRIDMYYLRRPATFRLFGTTLGRLHLNLRAVGRGIRAAVSH